MFWTDFSAANSVVVRILHFGDRRVVYGEDDDDGNVCMAQSRSLVEPAALASPIVHSFLEAILRCYMYDVADSRYQ